jgi:hypothetical protein
VRSFQAAAAASNATAAGAAAAQQGTPPLAGPQPSASSGNASTSEQSIAIGALIASSVKLGADLAASGHAVSLAADERVGAHPPHNDTHHHMVQQHMLLH